MSVVGRACVVLRGASEGAPCAVYEVAYQVIWHCLVEDTALFLRHFLERLTREKPDSVIQIFRRLLRFVPRLPTQAAHTLYNYLVGAWRHTQGPSHQRLSTACRKVQGVAVIVHSTLRKT